VLNVRDSTFTNNYAGHDGGNQGGGGAIFSNGSATIADSTFSNNTAYGGGDEASGGGGLGGGVYIAPFTEPPVATITGSTFAHNSVTGGGTEGAGAALACSCARLINSTLTGNSASDGNGGGGGAYFALGGTLVADTIDGNTAGSDATAGVFEIEATSTFLYTIVAENTNGSGSANCGGFDIPGGKLADASSQYNLEDDPAHGCGFDLPAADPELAALATNGGPTQTQALRPGSPALDATPIAACVDDGGTSLTVDQRGYPRPDAGEDVCDIGAYEAQDPGVTITTPADGATYPYGAVIDADFSCAPGPGESGPLSCVGTVPSGAPIDTLTIGSRSFTVTASDSSGLTTSRTVHYTVDRAPTDTTLNVSETSPGVNQPVTFTATVASSAAISVPPSGTVAFYVDTATDAAATVALSDNATASFTTSFGGGTHSVRAAYSGDDSYLPSSATANVGVSCNITITGRHAALVADKHATVCLSGATISGSLAVLSGATLDVENSIVSGAIVAQAPAAVRVCGSRIEATTVTHAVGPVFIGYPAQNCRANQISGALVANDNQGGLAIVDNVVTGTLVTVGNHPPVTIAGNHR
jgi:hypothetical protein